MADPTAYIAVLTAEFYIPSSQSLKAKRMVLRSLKDRVQSKFNASVAELDRWDKWQRAVCGVSIIGNDKYHLQSSIQSVLSFLETIRDIEITHHQIELL